MFHTRKINEFEWILLVIGFIVGFLGLYLINRLLVITNYALSGVTLSAIFLWLCLVFLIILVSVNENQKEELSEIIRDHKEETRLLKEVVKEQVKEIRLMKKKR